MPPAAAGAIALAGMAANAYGQKRAADKANRMLAPSAILNQMKRLNPDLYNAAYGSNPYSQGQPANLSQWLDQQSRMGTQGTGLQQIFHNPGYIDPRLMNYNLIQSQQGGQQALQNASMMIGRGGLEGGMAAAYALANQAATQQRNAQIFQQYNLAREDKRRQDIELSQGLLQQATSQSQQLAAQRAEMQANTPNIYSMIGQGLGTGLQAYGAVKSLGGGGKPTSYQGQQQGQQPGLQPGYSPVNVTGRPLFNIGQPMTPPSRIPSATSLFR